LPKKNFNLIDGQNATLITQVKDNQKNLLKQATHVCVANNKPQDSFCENISNKHGRTEERKYEVFCASSMSDQCKKDWPHIATVVKVTRTRERKRVDKNPTTTDSYYVCNRKLSAEKMAKYVREHWFIENKLHHVKDAVFREDFSVRVVRPFVFSYLIDVAINILKYLKINNIREFLVKSAMNVERLLTMMAGMLEIQSEIR
jgi:predicted transposase YbfD/YdcC